MPMNMIFPTRMSNNGLTGRSDDIGTMDLDLWAVISKTSGVMVFGQAGLTAQPCPGNEDVLEIGYLLKKEFWHCGLCKRGS